MKKTVIFMLLLVALPGALLFAKNNTFLIPKAEMQVNGLTCSMCNLSVYKSLKNIDFIDSIQTQLNSATYILYFKTGIAIDPGILRKQVEDAGFSIGKLDLYLTPVEGEITAHTHLAYGKFYFHLLNTPKQKEDAYWIAEVKDRKFISPKEYNQLRKGLSNHPCYTTGVTGSCCTEGKHESKPIYHLSF